MIYTVTFNPAVDYVVHTEKLESGSVNRTCGEEIYFGGKGINVSIVLNELGIKTKALGFIAGFTGEAIENGIRDKGIETDFIHLENGFSRINVKIKSDYETEINGQGPYISEADMEKLFEKLDEICDGDTLVLAGSVPDSMPQDIYEKILEYEKNRRIRTVVDATGELLRRVLKYKPFLIKPNIQELGELFGKKIKNKEEVKEYAQKLQSQGARNVLVSMAGDGAILVDENGHIYIREAFSGVVKNSVGAGDSMVAGFIAGIKSGDYEYALMLGTAAGSATAFSDGLATRYDIEKIMK